MIKSVARACFGSRLVPADIETEGVQYDTKANKVKRGPAYAQNFFHQFREGLDPALGIDCILLMSLPCPRLVLLLARAFPRFVVDIRCALH